MGGIWIFLLEGVFLLAITAQAIVTESEAHLDPTYKCPEPFGLSVHPECNKYFNCWEGTAWVQKCPDDWLFDPEKGWCNLRALVNCGNRKVLEVPGSLGEPETTNLKPTDGNSITKGSDTGFVCPKPSGQFRHNDCNKFYNCWNGVAYVNSCPNDWLYDIEKNWCNYPNLVKCGGRAIPSKTDISSTTNSMEKVTEAEKSEGAAPTPDPSYVCPKPKGQFAHPECNKFYNCWENVAYVNECPNDWLYDIEKNWCNYPQMVDCGDRKRPLTADKPVTPKPTMKTPEEESSTGTNPTPEPGYQCPKPTGQFAHPHCDKFYNCWEGVAYVNVCRDGWLYDVERNWCNYPQTVDCGDRIRPTNTGSSSKPTTKTPIELENSSKPPPTAEPGYVCPKPTGQFPHPECNKFYNCWEGTAYVNTCPNDWLYDVEKNWCNYPQAVECGERKKPGIPVAATTFEKPLTSKPTEKTTKEGPEKPKPVIDNAYTCPKSSGQFAHHDCRKFYDCFENVPFVKTCQNDWLYDPEKNWCNYAHLVNCGKRSRPANSESCCKQGSTFTSSTASTSSASTLAQGSKPGQVPAPDYVCPKPTGQFEHPECNKYYNCWEGVGYVDTCPNDWLYDVERNWCNYPQSVDCGDRVKPKVTATSTPVSTTLSAGSSSSGENKPAPTGSSDFVCPQPTGQFSHPNCEKFYNCWEGVSYINVCPNNWLYDVERNWCNYPEKVDCGDRIRPPGYPEYQKGPPMDPSYKCPKPKGQFPHPECNKFYDCWDNVAYVKECRNSWFYDSVRNWCNYPQSVDCGSRTIPSGSALPLNQPASSKPVMADGQTTPTVQKPTISTVSTMPMDGDSVIFLDSGAKPSPEISDIPSPPSKPVPTPHPGFKCPKPTGQFAHEDCDKYYDCWESAPFVMSCPTNTLFDAERKSCSFPMAVNCEGRKLTYSLSDAASNATVNETTLEKPAKPGPSADHTFKCPEAEGQFAHSECNKFYNCWDSVPYVYNCPQNTYFDEEKKWCDFPQAVRCGDRMLFVNSTGISTPPSWLIGRDSWFARPPMEISGVSEEPASLVVISHTNSASCQSATECISAAGFLQSTDMDVQGKGDISYNFLIGGDGHVYEGKGWERVNSMGTSATEKYVRIGFIGNFEKTEPNVSQLSVAEELLKYGVKAGKLTENYDLIGELQMTTNSSAEDKLFEIIKTWPHWIEKKYL